MYVRPISTRFTGGKSTPAMRAMLPPLALPLLVAGVLAHHADDAAAAEHLALGADRLDRRFHFHGVSYLNRYVIRPRVRSYGDSSTVTLSPGRIRMKCIRILPEMCARIMWPLSSLTRNMALGSVSETVP